MLGIAALLFAILPLVEGQPTVFLAIYVTACLATSVTTTAAFAMIAETVDYHEAQFGVRREGLLSAGVSLATKVGMAIGTAGIAFILAGVDYDPAAATDGARAAIRWSYYGGIITLLLVQIGIVLAWPGAQPRKAQGAQLALDGAA